VTTPRHFATAPGPTLTEVSCPERGLGHPLWLASLVLLIANDHVLKGAGLLPGWLTGKLSDFAGLIVAPVLFAAIARGRRPGARAAACAAVAAVFVAIKLSPPAARALEGTLALAHVPWRVWSDPTDLVALVVLPAAWWLTGLRAPVVPAVPAPARLRDRLLVIVGALGCLATSVEQPYYTYDLTLMNRTSGSRSLALYRADPAALDCAAIEAGNLGALTAAAFALETCAEIDPGKSVRLGSIVHVPEGNAPPSDAGGGAHCDALLIRAAGLADTVLTWPALAPESADLKAAELYLEEAGSRLYVAGTDYVDAAPAAFTSPASGCLGGP
jgi:hypothetical protein